MLNKWIAPLIVVAVLVLASCNDMDGDGEDDTSRETARRSAMEPNDPETKTDYSPAPRTCAPTDPGRDAGASEFHGAGRQLAVHRR